jgi:hypothetical protein
MASTARRLSGRGLLSQALAILYCRYSDGELRMSEYYENNLYDARNLSLQSLSEFLGERKEEAINNQLNDREWRVFSADKIAFYAFLKGLGLPFPPLYAIYHPRGRFIGNVQSITDRTALAQHLRSGMSYPFFSKPAHGGYGAGAALVEAYKRESDTLLMANGAEIEVDEYTRRLDASLAYGHLFQRPVQPHPTAQEVCSGKLATLRLNMLTDRQGPRVFRAFWCVPVGDSMVSNFGTGSSGTLLCAVNAETGVIQRAIQGPWYERKEISVHPSSGYALKGFRLPDWQQAIKIATAAARAVPRLLSTHWDVTLTPDGPMLLEVNFQNVFRGPQIAFGKGSLDSELREFLARNRVS